MRLSPEERASRHAVGRLYGAACQLADADRGAEARELLAGRLDLIERLDQRARQRSDDQLCAAASAAFATGHVEQTRELLNDRPDLLAAVLAERDRRASEEAADKARHDVWVSHYAPIIRTAFPGCPSSAINDIARVHYHPNVTPENVERLLRAHIRHCRTTYDDLFIAYTDRRKDRRSRVGDKERARSSACPLIDKILNEWRMVR